MRAKIDRYGRIERLPTTPVSSAALREQFGVVEELLKRDRDRMTETETMAFGQFRSILKGLKPLTVKQYAWAKGVLRRCKAKQRDRRCGRDATWRDVEARTKELDEMFAEKLRGNG